MSPSAVPRTALVVVNPISGRGRGRSAAREVARGLEDRGVRTELFETQARGDARDRAARAAGEFDRVVSVGGDGTLREVLDGLGPGDTPVGTLAFGTANVLAHELRLPREPRAFVDMVVAGRTLALDVMRVNGRLSFLCCGVGLDAAVVAEVERLRRGPITKRVYLGATLRALRDHRPPRIRVTVDGRDEGEHGFVLVSNFAGYGGVLRLDPAARPDDGRVEVYLFPRGTRGELVRAALRGALRHLPGGPVRRVHARSVRLDAPTPVPWQIDGDLGDTTPLSLELEERPRRLLVP